MINIQNLGLQESVGVKCTDGIYTKFVESSGLKATGVLVILLSQDGFKCDPETNFQTFTL